MVMRIRIREVTVRQALSRSGLPDIDYALNPYLGCSHGCLYCYAKMYTRAEDVVESWGWVVVVKKNIVEVLVKEVKKVKRGVVGIGTITDPYQPIEAVYRLTRGSIGVLAENGFRISIQTKSSLILRDLDLLKRFRDLVDVGITITSTKDSTPMRLLEPFSSPPSARIRTLRTLSSSGVKTWIFFGPIVPGFNDNLDVFEDILGLARETNSVVYIDKLRVKKFMWGDSYLRSIALDSSRYSWGKLLETMFSMCRDRGVVCRSGFEYSEEKQSKTLDEYSSRW